MTNRFTFLFRSGLAILFLLTGTFVPAQIISEFIFREGSAPFASSHASTIVELNGGGLMSAWFGGSSEGKSDVAIWGSRRPLRVWSKPVELVREPDVACWNPVLFHTHDGRLWLYYKFGPSVATWTAGRKYSDDEGITWSASEHLPAGLLGPVRAKPLVLSGGTIVSGTSFETYRSWAVWIERSTDDGKTWAKIGPIVLPTDIAKAPAPGSPDWMYRQGIIQPSIIDLGKKHLRLYARSTEQTGRVCVADSFDIGITWTRARPLDVPNPNSGIDAVALRDGRIVLVYNNTTNGRTPLNLAVSTDGEKFRMFYTLESTPGEYSYPSMIQSAAGDLEITYTWNRKSIRHVHFPLAEIPSAVTK